MKYIIVADTHLGVKKGNDVYIQSTISLFDQICKYASDNKIKSIIHCGDFFDTRKSLSLKVIDISQEIMSSLEDVFNSIYLIIGNHDTYLKNQIKPTSLSIFNEHDKTYVIDRPYTINNILLMPWLFDKSLLDGNLCNICIGHFDINGIEMNSSGFTPLHQKLKIGDFKNFKKVISGHYHVPSITNNIHYLGSPMQFTFNEINQTTGFYELDSETTRLKFIEFDDYPKHIIITDEYKYTPAEIRNNNVNLIFNKDYGIEENTKIIHNVNDCNPNTLNISYFNVSDTLTKDVSENPDIKNKKMMLMEYYKKSDLPSNIKYDILKNIIEKLYIEMKGEKE